MEKSEKVVDDRSVSDGEIQSAAPQIDPAEEKRVLRKIDRVILPLMCTVYFFQYLDKQAVGYAAVFGLQEDLDLSSNEYSWVVSIFYLGQLASEYVFIYMMSRLQVARFVGIMMCVSATPFCLLLIWGAVAGCLAAPHNFSGFAAVRFVLGACEGAVSPAFVIITSSWYKKQEHPIRVAAWVSCNGFASIVAALIMYGVGYAENVALANWRVMFLICGGATIACGIVFLLLMPQSPETAWFLNEEERKIACNRLRSDGFSSEEKVFKKSQVWDALKDPFCWAAVIFAFLGTFASPVLKFASLVINGFGWSKFNTMLVGLPSGAFQIFFIWATVIGIRLTKIPRCYWGVAVTIVPLVGNIGVAAIPASNKWGVVIFTWLASSISPIMVVSLSLMASNIKGNTKKSATSNAYFILYAVAAVIAPQLWQTRDAPRYIKGIVADIVCFGLIICTFLGYSVLVVRENRKRDGMHLTAEQEGMVGKADVTDREDLTFRYTR
ncbi:major facilitator superfamily domain-containing protein [Aspergillus karnatakaensis]|uniref:major facilitator superfamily domain-containing protein n=1 Tax=Aspergillus karnatakaensis TaxID=1810916 RepID=UPI003CCCF19C